MADRHLDYGPAFQGIESIRAGNGEAIGRLKPMPADARRYQIHPALLDSAWQVLAAARSTDLRTTLVPVSVDRVRLSNRRTGSGALWTQARWTVQGSRMCGDVRLVTDAGELVADARGIGLEPLEGSPAAERDEFYAVAWEKQPATGDARDGAGEGGVLIFADSAGVGSGLAERISARGGVPVLVAPGSDLRIPENLAVAPCRINPDRGDDYAGLLAELTRRGVALDSAVHLWSLDVGEDSSEAAQVGWGSALHLTQAMVRSRIRVPPRLWLVTRGAQYVLEGDDVAPFRAPLWGLARTIAQEHPELACTAIDLGATATEREIPALVEEVWRRGAERQVAFRQDARFVARLSAGETVSSGSSPGREDGLAGPFRACLTETGNLSSVAFRHVARRRPAADDVEIEVAAAGLNFRDVLLALGLLPAGRESVLGHECAGRITALGDRVAGFSVGDEVVALARPSCASLVRTHASLVAPKPARLDLEDAATLPIAFLTAYYSVNYLGRLQRGERLLVHSATGAVGLACLRMAQEAGAEIYATAGTDEKRRLLESLGVRLVMDSRSLAFADEVRHATGGDGVDVIVNSLAGEALVRGLALLRPGGRFVELGKRDLLERGQIPLRYLDESRSFFLVDLSSLAEKRPDFCGRLLRESLELFEDKGFAPLPKRVFAAPDLAEALHHMARGQHIGKVVVRMDQGSVTVAPPTDPSARIRDDASYIVTGGLGGIGLVVARWLVEQGARTLVLAGRREPSAEAREAVAAMERAGATVVVDGLDVADADSVNAAFARWRQHLPPVRGIVHAAGVLDDGILLQQTPERFRGVMAAKVDGAWNLHRASLTCPLDFFVLFSSAASVLGSAGQSNYAAANQFLDALAHYRRARHLSGVSINWGPWSEVGLAARPGRGGRLAIAGIGSLAPRHAVDALGKVLLGDAAQVAVMSVDWREWRNAQPLLGDMPFFSGVDGTGPDRVATPNPIRAQLLAAAPDERIRILTDRLRQHVAGVLRLAASRVDLDQPLVTMGIDSLMAVELKNRVERESGIAIPLLHLIKGPSLAELARSLVSSMTGDAVSVPEHERERSASGAGTGQSLLVSLLSVKDGAREETA